MPHSHPESANSTSKNEIRWKMAQTKQRFQGPSPAAALTKAKEEQEKPTKCDSIMPPSEANSNSFMGESTSQC